MDDVSAFIVGTSTVHPKLYSDVFHSMQIHILSTCQVFRHHFQCGSSIEFYVEPMNSCIDDTDTLVCNVDEVAFTEDIPFLPDDVSGFLDTMNCSQILPYPDYPGFVKLRLMGKMRYNWRIKMFEFQQAKRPRNHLRFAIDKTPSLCGHISEQEHNHTGPALKLIKNGNISSDIVLCVWCPQWPKEAENWPLRRRNYGWPSTLNIREIVQGGCHVVNAKHPTCRSDILQCRLSFSIAEVILLHSWTPVQQIVYHMLRFFAKKELINKDCPKEDEVLCTYHFKTLMLWSCEEMPRNWWNSLTVIEISCHILRKLSEWLKIGYCPNYFIPQANLFHKDMNKEVVNETTRRLNELCRSDILTDWFADKYIRPILDRVSNITVTRNLMTDFGKCMRLIGKILDKGKLAFFDWEFSIGFCLSVEHTIRDVMRQKSYAFLMYTQNLHGAIKITQKTFRLSFFLSAVEFSSNFQQFVKVLFSLHAANALGFEQVTYESDIITEFVREVSWQSKVLKSKHQTFPKPNGTIVDRSFVLFLKAQILMENLTGTNRPLEFKLVSQLSNCLLRKALECEDSKSKTITSATLAYMAALHFAASEIKTAFDLCSRVIFNQTTEEKDEETLNAGCLLFIGDISGIIGFYLLFRQIKHNFYYNKKLYLLDLRITPEVFAMFLINLSKIRRPMDFRNFCDLRTPRFLLDEILITMTNWKSSGKSKSGDIVLRVYQRSNPTTKLEVFNQNSNQNSLETENGIIQLLIEYSLENMTLFYDAICKDFNIQCNIVDCYRASSLYKSRKFLEALNLCEAILNEPDTPRELREFTFANVMVLPPLDSYFDTDIQCLLGLHTLVFYLSPLNEELCKIEGTADSTFQQLFAREIYFEKHPLSTILKCHYSEKSYYFLRRDFLARYLKVRCLIDRNNSHSEVTYEFKKLKSNFKKLKSILPFEHIMRCFLQQKLRQL